MAAQFFISLCWLFWAAMYSFLFLFYLVLCQFNLIPFWVQIRLLLLLSAEWTTKTAKAEKTREISRFDFFAISEIKQ